MATSKVKYDGQLRTSAIHTKSQTSIITDAPTDNNGKGEAFSPTDLIATALASCMMTIMGIRADKGGINIDGADAQVTKIMDSNPRRIKEIIVTITMPNNGYSDKEKEILQKAALTCPVALTLHPDVIQTINIAW